MKFLVDESLSVHISSVLGEAGYDSVHVLDRSLGGAPDADVSALAAAEGRAVISADSDFTTMLAIGGHSTPSLILLRSLDHLKPAEQAAILVANLPGVEPDLDEGAVVSIGGGHVRVRRLPI